MFRRLIANIKKEIKLGWRSYYFLLIVGIALLYFAFLTFVIPEDMAISPDLYYLNELGTGETDMIFRAGEAENPKLHIVTSREELESGMKKNFNSIGLVAKGGIESPEIEMVFQGHESKEVRSLLKLSLLERFNVLTGDIPIINLSLDKGEDTEKIPTNKWMLPVFILTEAVMMGMIFVFAMIFIDKSQGTMKSFAVTPGKLWEYLAAKAIFLIILGTIFCLILPPLIVGFSFNYLELILVAAVGSLFATSVALIVAGFYNNISESLYALMGINLIFFLPVISYVIPTFSPWYVRILPTYTILFSLRDIIFPGVVGTYNLSSIWGTLAVSLVTFIIGVQVNKILLRRA